MREKRLSGRIKQCCSSTCCEQSWAQCTWYLCSKPQTQTGRLCDEHYLHDAFNLFFTINPDPAQVVSHAWRTAFRLHLTGIAFVCDPRRLAVKPSLFGWPSMSKMDQAGSPESAESWLNFRSQVSFKRSFECCVPKSCMMPERAFSSSPLDLGSNGTWNLVRSCQKAWARTFWKVSTKSLLPCLTTRLVTTQWKCSQELKDTLGCSSYCIETTSIFINLFEMLWALQGWWDSIAVAGIYPADLLNNLFSIRLGFSQSLQRCVAFGAAWGEETWSIREKKRERWNHMKPIESWFVVGHL